MDDRSEESRSLGSTSEEGSTSASYSEEWGSSPGEETPDTDDASEHSSDDDDDSYSKESSMKSSDSQSKSTYDDESEASERDEALNGQFENSPHSSKSTNSGSHSQRTRSDDETDTCLLSIDEHVKRRKTKALIKRLQQHDDAHDLNLSDSGDSESLDSTSVDQTEIQTYFTSLGDTTMGGKSKVTEQVQNDDSAEAEEMKSNDSRSDDETDTCMLSIDEHVRRRYSKWKQFRATLRKREPVDLACIASNDGSSESGAVQSQVAADLPPHEDRRFDHNHGSDWRISNWKKKEAQPKESSRKGGQVLKGVEYMSAIDMASTNRDISVVEPGISRKAAREAFEKKEVPDEIPVMLNDDVSSIYPPIRKPARFLYPPKRAPYNGMILEDPVSYDEELGDASTKQYDMSIVASEGKKQRSDVQRSDIELVLIAVISLSLLILVILLIVILAKNS